MKKKTGFSLIEILIVIFIFSIIGTLSVSAVLMTMKGSKKSDSQVRVRENINYAFSVIERQVRNSESVTCTASTTVLDYISSDGISSSFSCVDSGADKFIASDSSRLTSEDVLVSDCSITCSKTENNPAVIKVRVNAEDKNSNGSEKGSVTAETEIITRNY